MKLEIVSGGSDNAQELFAATERLRQETLEKNPVAMPAEKEKRKVAAPPSKLIYGKSLKGESVPMSTVELDSGRVVVEGKVIAINHKELTKSKAWVINFDMTDYTGPSG